MDDIAAFGAGGFGREVKMLIEQINRDKKKFNFKGFYDDGIEKGEVVNGAPVLGGIEHLNNINKKLGIVISLADPETKKQIANKLTNGNIWFPVLIHPSVKLDSKSIEIGAGAIICGGNILTVDITIGKHVILNLSCTVGHNSVIGDFSSIMPTVNISGETVIGNGVLVGTGANIINQLRIGENSVIGAGGVVIEDIPANCTAVGNPAKPIKFHNEY